MTVIIHKTGAMITLERGAMITLDDCYNPQGWSNDNSGAWSNDNS